MASSLLLILISQGDSDDTSNQECGRCEWEEHGWPEKIKEQTPLTILLPCRHTGGLIPGCYFCGTRNDVREHTCKKKGGDNERVGG